MRMIEEEAIVTNPDILNETYIPPNIPGREAQIKELTDCLSPALRKKKPIYSWLFGKPGTGKTLIARYILEKIEREAYVSGVYINCWEYNSYYSVLDKLVRQLRILGAEKLSTAFKMERLVHYLGNRPFLIILDEIDQPAPREREAILYNLSNIGNVGLTCICNSRYVLFCMDDRIKSRLNLKLIEFKPYSDRDLLFIFEQRAEFALRSKAYSRKILEMIAEKAEGDARVAIQTLKNSAYNAENDSSKEIREKHVVEGFNSAKDLKKTYLLNKLTEHHRILYELVKEKKDVQSGKLWELYLQKCKSLNKQPIALRTYSEYMNKLIELGKVGVDSGQLLLVDPCYLNEHKQVSSYEKILKARGFPDKMNLSDQLKYDLGHDGLGVVFNSGLGDGIYKVYGKLKDFGKLGKRLADIRIVLIEDD